MWCNEHRCTGLHPEPRSRCLHALPALVDYREQIAREKRRAYRDWEYWGKPVLDSAIPTRVSHHGTCSRRHGSNRTGRPFTGDSSGNFMYPVLHETGFANQPTATDRNDGMKLKDLYITAAVRCAPPDNKPLPVRIGRMFALSGPRIGWIGEGEGRCSAGGRSDSMRI